MHIVGPQQAFRLDIRSNYDPADSIKFEKAIVVGTLSKEMTKAQLMAFVSATSIDNSNIEFNCQVWVSDAVQRLVGAGYLTAAEGDEGIGGMVDATLEAKDDVAWYAG